MPITWDNNKGLVKVRANIRSNLPEALLQAGKDIVNLASQLAPKDSGDLSRSGKAELKGSRTVDISFGNDLPDNRAQAQEYGTFDMPAQPYLTPALRAIDILHYVRIAVFAE